MSERAIAVIPNSAPLYFIFFPKNRIRKKDKAGIAGISQAVSKNHPLAWTDLVGIDAASVNRFVMIIPSLGLFQTNRRFVYF